MKFYLFTETWKKNHKEGCVYALWDKEKKEMAGCGKEAIGSMGAGGKHPLCKEHFDLARSMYGVSDVAPLKQADQMEKA